MIVFTVLDLVLRANEHLSRVPVLGPLKDAVLDIVFGPAEDFEYISRTAPSSPPPIY